MTTALWILLGAALLLTAFNLLKVGVDAAYDGETLVLRAKAGPVKLTILPKQEKPKKQEKKKKQKPPKEKPEKPKEKTKLPLSTLLKLAEHVLRAIGSFRRKLQVDLLRLRVRVGTPDPYNTAMYYGWLQSAVCGLQPMAARALNVRRQEVQLAPDFTSDAVSADGRLILTIRIGQIVGIVLVLAWRALVTYLRRPKKPKNASKSKPEAPSAERTEIYG